MKHIGKRYEIPLEGRNIEIVVYLKRPDAPVVFCGFGGGFVFGGCALDDMLWNTIHDKLDVTLVSIDIEEHQNSSSHVG